MLVDEATQIEIKRANGRITTEHGIIEATKEVNCGVRDH